MINKNIKILIITHWFYPKQIPRAFRAYELYKKLSNYCHVDVVIGDWKEILKSGEDYKKKLEKYSKNINKNKNSFYSNLKFIQIIKAIIEFFVGERYIFNSGSFLNKNVSLKEYDVVISIGLPFYIHWITSLKLRKYKKNNGKIISISDWGDPFVGVTDKKIAFYFRYIQKNICNIFDYIVIPTEQAIKYYQKYTNKNKIIVIPQGVDFEKIQLEEYVKNDIPNFIYTGIFYEKIRNPEEFFKFLCGIKTDFIFTIYTIKHGTVYTNIIKKYEKILGKKLKIYDLIPRLECIKQLSKNDFLINIENETSTQIPSKLIDYALSKRPILSFKQNEIPEEKFKQFLKGNYKGAKKINIEEFDINKVAEKFIKIIEDKI